MGIETYILGCKVNYADVQAIAARLGEGREQPVALVGTCCVTAEGEKQSRKEVRRAVRRVGSQGKVYVAGCAARRNPAVFKAMGENITVLAEEAGQSAGSLAAMPEFESAAVAGAIKDPGPVPRTRFFLKVQDGCDRGCAYCVIPQVRGLPRSIPADEVQSTALAAVAKGFPELVVTGINVGAYRDGDCRLPQLIERLARIEGLVRLRLSSIEINYLTPELLEALSNHGVIGTHLHLPLQSGDDKVLETMGRRYGRDRFSLAVEEARRIVPEMNFTTDIIVGFPGEDVDAFERTLEFIEKTGFSRVHVFSYSPRPATGAHALGDPVAPGEKKRRSLLARRLSGRLQKAHGERKVGELSEVLLESSQPSGMCGGYSHDYTRFLVAGGRSGEMVRVRAESVTREGVWGKVEADD